MAISTFKDNTYKAIDKISLFGQIIIKRDGKSVNIPRFIYDNENNPKKLLEFAEGLQQQKENFERISNQTLTDVEFFEIYKEFYRWDPTEIAVEISKQQFKNPKTTRIKTDDVSSMVRQEGHGRDFSWWTEWYNVKYDVVTESNFKFEDRVYTKSEISVLVRQKKVMVINTDIMYGERLNDQVAYSHKKRLDKINVQPTKLHHKFDYFGYALDSKDIEVLYEANPEAFAVIRKSLTPQQLAQDYKKYMREYNKAIKLIDAHLQTYVDTFTQKEPYLTFDAVRNYISRKQNPIKPSPKDTEDFSAEKEPIA